jgi:hypothetical protein
MRDPLVENGIPVTYKLSMCLVLRYFVPKNSSKVRRFFL